MLNESLILTLDMSGQNESMRGSTEGINGMSIMDRTKLWAEYKQRSIHVLLYLSCLEINEAQVEKEMKEQ
jgi:hypothetical protein